MQFGGRYVFDTGRLKVWEALNDTEILKQTIPGCTRIDWVGENALEAQVAVDLGVAKPVFTGDLTLSNIVPAESYTLSGRGKGGLLGLAHGSADIALSDEGEKCLLSFTATGGGSGTLMKMGKAVIGSSAQHVIDRFFERFADAMQVDLQVLAPESDGAASP